MSGSSPRGGRRWSSPSTLKYGNTRYATIQTAYLIGLPADVKMAGYAFSFLTGEIARLAQEAADVHSTAIRAMAKDRGISHHDAESIYVGRTGTHPLKVKPSFTLGASHGVIEMLVREERERRSTGDEATNALVLNREAIIRDYWYQKNYGKTYDEYQADFKERMAKNAAANPLVPTKPLSPSAARRQSEAAERRWRKQEEARQRAEDRKLGQGRLHRLQQRTQGGPRDVGPTGRRRGQPQGGPNQGGLT